MSISSGCALKLKEPAYNKSAKGMHGTVHENKLAGQTELVADAILDDKIVDLSPDYPCLYDLRSPDFKNREIREKAFEEIAEKLQKTGKI